MIRIYWRSRVKPEAHRSQRSCRDKTGSAAEPGGQAMTLRAVQAAVLFPDQQGETLSDGERSSEMYGAKLGT